IRVNFKFTTGFDDIAQRVLVFEVGVGVIALRGIPGECAADLTCGASAYGVGVAVAEGVAVGGVARAGPSRWRTAAAEGEWIIVGDRDCGDCPGDRITAAGDEAERYRLADVCNAVVRSGWRRQGDRGRSGAGGYCRRARQRGVIRGR